MKQALTPDQTRTIALKLIGNEEVRARIDRITDYDCSWGAPGLGRFRVNILRQDPDVIVIGEIPPGAVSIMTPLGSAAVLPNPTEAGDPAGAQQGANRGNAVDAAVGTAAGAATDTAAGAEGGAAAEANAEANAEGNGTSGAPDAPDAPDAHDAPGAAGAAGSQPTNGSGAVSPPPGAGPLQVSRGLEFLISSGYQVVRYRRG